jgi:hypothetical protein
MSEPKTSPRRQTPKRDNALLVGLTDRVEETIRLVGHPGMAQEQRQILERMTTDERMPKVWTALTSRKRPSREFVYPVIRDNDGTTSKDDTQSETLRELFYFVFCAARDKITVSLPSQIEESKERLLRTVTTMRSVAQDLDLAIITGQLGVVDENDKILARWHSDSLRQVGNWLDHLAGAHRPLDDVLVVERQSGDPVARGVQILIAAKLNELFGSVLHGIAATLSSVALGKKTSVKTTRAAFGKQKSINKGIALILKK